MLPIASALVCVRCALKRKEQTVYSIYLDCTTSCFTLIILLMLFLTRICIVLVAAAAAAAWFSFLLDVKFDLFHCISFFRCTMSRVGETEHVHWVHFFSCNGIYLQCSFIVVDIASYCTSCPLLFSLMLSFERMSTWEPTRIESP